MTRREDRMTLMAGIGEASAAGARLAPACSLAGIDLRTFQRWPSASSPGAARACARQRSKVATLTPTSRDTTSMGALSGGSSRATMRSLNACPYRATLDYPRPLVPRT